MQNTVKDNILLFVSVSLLMLLNWWLEVYKWRYFTLKIQYLTLTDSIKSVLIGIVAGIFTPNRVGELGGRLLFINNHNRSSAIYINSLCAISQLVATIVFGLMAFSLISGQLECLYVSSLNFKIVSWVLILTTLYIFFKANILRRVILKFNKHFKKNSTINFIELSFIDRFKLLTISIIRYCIFCVQFIFLLAVFLPGLNFLEGLISASLIFLLTTIIPSGWISDLPVRTSFAFLVIEFLGYNGAYGSMASVILWIINLFIPAILGLVVIKDLKWRPKHGN